MSAYWYTFLELSRGYIVPNVITIRTLYSSTVFLEQLFGLSKERRILGDHAKAHIHEIRRISREIQRTSWNPPKNLINQITQQKLFSFMQCSGKAMSLDSHEICRISKDQLPGMITPMFGLTLLPEIQWISCEIHPKPYKIRCFNKNSSVWGVQGGGYDPGFHEILVHSPSPTFIKLNSFGWNIWFYKVLGGFHEIRRISCEIERPLARNCNPMF